MNSPEIVWLRNGRILKQVEDTIQVIPGLPKKVYNMGFNPDRNEIFLEEFAEQFHFDFKIYGMESKLINHIMATFENTTSNLGILFNGVKGTGKTITAKILANKMNLPVILVNSPFSGLSDFVSKINCPCVLFFDEFEKNFDASKKQDVDLLSIMDGVFNSPHRRVFLLTTNKLYINENLIGRPSRIRYKKSFGNLSKEVIMEYLDDCLVDKSYVPEILEFIDTLSISTIDILKSVVEEINIHKVPLSNFKHFLNVEQAKYTYFTKMHCFDNNDFDASENKFKEILAKVGSTDVDDDGKEYTLDEDDLDIYSRKINTTSSLEFIQVGEDLGEYGVVTYPLDKDGIIGTEDEYGRKLFFKVLNLDHRPSLYRGGLAY